MSINVVYVETNVCHFVEALRQLTDDRDNRGKRHALAFVVAGVVLVLPAGITQRVPLAVRSRT